jgi:peptidoglycan/LPS O-acetylase OafA/YrhL
LLITQGFERTLNIDPASISDEVGLAFQISTPTADWLTAYSDGPNHELRSTARLFEDGHPLGPAHSLHKLIRNSGGGAFSHWNGQIRFSTTDNSDPRKNGRHYSLSATFELSPLYWWLAVSCLAIILLFHVGSYWEPLTRVLADRQRKLSVYRHDITGLRAVAVCLVILFHLGFAWLPGGYIGVDVFFVISGYLITGKIVHDIGQGTFSFPSFYQRRIRRIFPALFGTVVATLALGVILLTPGDYLIMAESARYAVAGLSNLYFNSNTGYFDANSGHIPLLHTWSLGVEEQFYLLWPAILYALIAGFGFHRRWLAISLAAIAALSFAANLDIIRDDIHAAFYMPYTRAWEFAVGAIVSVMTIRRIEAALYIGETAAALGITIIIGAALFYSVQTPFPGFAAVAPVAGAALVIAPFRQSGFFRAALSTPPFTLIGTTSYSLYLWHWPVVTLYRHYHFGRETSAFAALILLVIIVCVSWVSWKWIEQPFRAHPENPWRTIAKGTAAAVALLLVSTLGIASGGLLWRMPDSGKPYASLREMTNWPCPQDKNFPELGHACILGAKWDEARVHGFLIGDSHADHFAPLLDMAARAIGISLIKSYGTCFPLVGPTSVRRDAKPPLWSPHYNSECAKLNDPIVAFLRQHNDIGPVVIAAAWSDYPPELYLDGTSPSGDATQGLRLMGLGIDELVSALQTDGDRQIIVLSDIATADPAQLFCLADSPIILRAACPTQISFPPSAETNEMIRALSTHHRNLSVVIPQDAQCAENGCRTFFSGEFIYRDGHHLRKNLSETAKRDLIRSFGLREVLESAVEGHNSLVSHTAPVGVVAGESRPN